MNEQITVMKDENLGGVEREYREVRRKADVGERIKIINNRMAHPIPTGTIGILGRGETMEYDEIEYFIGRGMEPDHFRDYVVLVPTDVIRVNGERLRMVDRSVNDGDRVIIVKNNEHFRHEPYKVGSVYSVKGAIGSHIQETKEHGFGISVGHYRVLEPVGPVNAAKPTEIERLTADLAALAVKYTEMERRVAALEAKGTEQLPDNSRGQESPTRDEIIERAKADVAHLPADIFERSVWCGTGYDTPGHMRVEFDVNREKRTVVALVYHRYISGSIWSRGIAKCAPGDVFNSHIGRAIALRRALGLEVPDEYVNAPQPTEVRVGDIVRGGISGKKAKVGRVDDKGRVVYGSYEDGTRLYTVHFEVDDDSREDETEVSA